MVIYKLYSAAERKRVGSNRVLCRVKWFQRGKLGSLLPRVEYVTMAEFTRVTKVGVVKSAVIFICSALNGCSGE